MSSGLNGTIESPNYPSAYDSDLHCVWYLPTSNVITLTFVDFEVVMNA